MPRLLSVAASLPAGMALPKGWQDRESIGSWTAKVRLADTPNDEVVCYASTEAEWTEVQVLLLANGTVSAAIDKDSNPCDPQAL